MRTSFFAEGLGRLRIVGRVEPLERPRDAVDDGGIDTALKGRHGSVHLRPRGARGSLLRRRGALRARQRAQLAQLAQRVTGLRRRPARGLAAGYVAAAAGAGRGTTAAGAAAQARGAGHGAHGGGTTAQQPLPAPSTTYAHTL